MTVQLTTYHVTDAIQLGSYSEEMSVSYDRKVGSGPHKTPSNQTSDRGCIPQTRNRSLDSYFRSSQDNVLSMLQMEGSNDLSRLHGSMLQQQKYYMADIGVGFGDHRKDYPTVITLV